MPIHVLLFRHGRFGFGGQREGEEKAREGGGKKRCEELERKRQLTVTREREENIVVTGESERAAVEEGDVATKAFEVGGDGGGVEVEEERTEVSVVAGVQNEAGKPDREQITSLLLHRTLEVREKEQNDSDSGREEQTGTRLVGLKKTILQHRDKVAAEGKSVLGEDERDGKGKSEVELGLVDGGRIDGDSDERRQEMQHDRVIGGAEDQTQAQQANKQEKNDVLSVPVHPFKEQPVGVGLGLMRGPRRVVFEQRENGVDVKLKEFEHLRVGGVAIRQTNPEQTLLMRITARTNPDLFRKVDLFGGEGVLFPLALVVVNQPQLQQAQIHRPQALCEPSSEVRRQYLHATSAIQQKGQVVDGERERGDEGKKCEDAVMKA